MTVAVLLATGAACGSSPPPGPASEAVVSAEADLTFVIPAGSGSRLDAGEELDLVPAVIRARVGDVLRIENEDDRGFLIGPFYVGPHETLTQRFSSPGEYQGLCYVHPSGTVRVVVTG